jgi:hypothetical protein
MNSHKQSDEIECNFPSEKDWIFQVWVAGRRDKLSERQPSVLALV